jgi:hypothetical protein
MLSRRNVFRFSILIIILLILVFLPLSGCQSSDIAMMSEKQAPLAAVQEKTVEMENILPVSLPGSGSGIRPVAVMVENSFAARPQSGLILADVVYEVVDEYGITRFVAIYSSNEAPVVGPVRSTRPYYADIARAFDPIYAFFGTYPQCYGYVESLGMYVLSAMTDR